MDTDKNPARTRYPVPGQPPWTQLELFDQDEPRPLRDLLVQWAVGYSPADPDPYED